MFNADLSSERTLPFSRVFCALVSQLRARFRADVSLLASLFALSSHSFARVSERTFPFWRVFWRSRLKASRAFPSGRFLLAARRRSLARPRTSRRAHVRRQAAQRPPSFAVHVAAAAASVRSQRSAVASASGSVGFAASSWRKRWSANATSENELAGAGGATTTCLVTIAAKYGGDGGSSMSPV